MTYNRRTHPRSQSRVSCHPTLPGMPPTPNRLQSHPQRCPSNRWHLVQPKSIQRYCPCLHTANNVFISGVGSKHPTFSTATIRPGEVISKVTAIPPKQVIIITWILLGMLQGCEAGHVDCKIRRFWEIDVGDTVWTSAETYRPTGNCKLLGSNTVHVQN